MRLLLATLAFVTLLGCAPAPAPTSEGPDIDAIHAIISDINEAKTNPARAAAHYRGGAIILREGRAIGVTPTIEDYYRTIAATRELRFQYSEPSILEISSSGDLGYALMSYYEVTRTPNNDAYVAADGAGLVVFAKQGGVWIITAESRAQSGTHAIPP